MGMYGIVLDHSKLRTAHTVVDSILAAVGISTRSGSICGSDIVTDGTGIVFTIHPKMSTEVVI
jgi:hypothetical protein